MIFSKIKTQAAKYFARRRERYRRFFRRHMEFEARQKKLKLEQKKISRQLRYLRHFRHGEQPEEEAELSRRFMEIQTQMDELHFQTHVHAYAEGGDLDFERYYRHMERSRLFGLLFNLALWALIFWLIGLGSGLTAVAVFFAVAMTFGCVYEIVFQSKISERILKPVDDLKQGVREVTKGNYDVQIENENTNEVASLIRAFNEMARKLRESEKIQREYEENRKTLIANISHDLRTPITSIQGYVEALADPQLPAEKKGRYLTVLRSNAIYMNRLVDDLFVFSKLDLQKLDFHFEKIPIRPFLRDMMEEFRIDLEEKNVRFLYCDGLTKDYIVKLDGKRVHQILRNLIGNAVRHGAHDEPTEIGVRLSESAGKLHIAIADNGPGIPPESLPHVFERFYRADPERTKHLESTGLGLAIAKELTEAHGGTISVESKAGAGTCFTVSFPWVAETETKEEDAPA